MLQNNATDPYDNIHPQGGMVDVWIMDDQTVICDPILVNAVVDAVVVIVDVAVIAAAAAEFGTACATGIVPPAADAVTAVTADWLDQFERVQLILRLSGS